MVFRPSDGILYVGSSKEIECVLESNATSSESGKYGLKDLKSRGDLISTNEASVPVRISPPEGAATYPLHGWTEVECTWTHGTTGKQTARNLTVRILREF